MYCFPALSYRIRIVTQTMHYFIVIGFLDEEPSSVGHMCRSNERKGWDVDNSELSIRAYDDNLRQNVDAETYANQVPVELLISYCMNIKTRIATQCDNLFCGILRVAGYAPTQYN